ncbi:MAG: BlaI/MecI/CopY family transcriptional regulator [Cellulosilyticaceae bacterium]
MSKNIPKISDAELEIMNIVWESAVPINSYEILERLPETNEWKKPTVLTLIGRLVEKEALTYTKQGRFYYYTPAITRADYRKVATRTFFDKLYQSSFKNLVATLYQSKDITKEDIESLKEMFKEED